MVTSCPPSTALGPQGPCNFPGKGERGFHCPGSRMAMGRPGQPPPGDRVGIPGRESSRGLCWCCLTQGQSPSGATLVPGLVGEVFRAPAPPALLRHRRPQGESGGERRVQSTVSPLWSTGSRPLLPPGTTHTCPRCHRHVLIEVDAESCWPPGSLVARPCCSRGPADGSWWSPGTLSSRILCSTRNTPKRDSTTCAHGSI